jgi:hypothetical protein
LEIAEELSAENKEKDGLGITCAALAFDSGAVQCFYPKRNRFAQAAEGRYPFRMTQDECRLLALKLMKLQEKGCEIITWNGLKFDFHVLAVECGSEFYYQKVAEVALDHIDMMFGFYAYKGWMLKMTKATDAMGLGGKSEGMTGVDAVNLWKTGTLNDQQQVLRYVKQDARLTARLYEEALRESRLAWRTKRGGISYWDLPMEPGEFPTVMDAIAEPVPDTSWMGRPPIPREAFYAWTGYREGDGET